MSIIEQRWLECESFLMLDLDSQTRKKLQAIFVGGCCAATEAVDAGVSTRQILQDGAALVGGKLIGRKSEAV